jgi:hypothetical protein
MSRQRSPCVRWNADRAWLLCRLGNFPRLLISVAEYKSVWCASLCDQICHAAGFFACYMTGDCLSDTFIDLIFEFVSVQKYNMWAAIIIIIIIIIDAI